jgi:uncharacterized LabA/DUF88 family protein
MKISDNKKMKTFLFIDGTNLYAAQYQLFGPDKYLNFPSFIREIEDKIKVKFDKIYFYASYTPKKTKPTKREKQYIINEFKFYQSVKKTKSLIFFKGYRSKTSGKEKEVDVKLATDLVGYGLLSQYDTAYLMTGDADFLQALFFIKKHNPKITVKIICLDKKIMYKGAFYFDTFILNFSNQRLNFHPKQKIKIINIKNPAELCQRVG